MSELEKGCVYKHLMEGQNSDVSSVGKMFSESLRFPTYNTKVIIPT